MNEYPQEPRVKYHWTTDDQNALERELFNDRYLIAGGLMGIVAIFIIIFGIIHYRREEFFYEESEIN